MSSFNFETFLDNEDTHLASPAPSVGMPSPVMTHSNARSALPLSLPLPPFNQNQPASFVSTSHLLKHVNPPPLAKKSLPHIEPQSPLSTFHHAVPSSHQHQQQYQHQQQQQQQHAGSSLHQSQYQQHPHQRTTTQLSFKQPLSLPMAKRKHQPTTETTPPGPSLRLPSIAPIPVPIVVDNLITAEVSTSASIPTGTTDSKKSSFWTQPGIVPFVSWLTDPDNHKTLNKKKTTAGETTNEMLDKLRAYVKDKSGIEWTREQVKGKIQYAKKKYDAANKLRTSTGEGNDITTLRSRMLDHCPYFDQFHAVYSSSLARNPPPPHQSVKYPGDRTIDMESEEETDDLDGSSSEEDDLIIGKSN